MNVCANDSMACYTIKEQDQQALASPSPRPPVIVWLSRLPKAGEHPAAVRQL